MTTGLEAVADFQKTFDTPMTKEFWGSLIIEELKEAQDALEALLLEIADVTYVTAGLCNAVGSDIGYTLLSDLVDEQIKQGVLDEGLQLLLAEVMDNLDPEVSSASFLTKHKSNMSKVNPDGSVSRDPDTGKILKPEGYKQPTLKGVL